MTRHRWRALGAWLAATCSVWLVLVVGVAGAGADPVTVTYRVGPGGNTFSPDPAVVGPGGALRFANTAPEGDLVVTPTDPGKWNFPTTTVPAGTTSMAIGVPAVAGSYGYSGAFGPLPATRGSVTVAAGSTPSAGPTPGKSPNPSGAPTPSATAKPGPAGAATPAPGPPGAPLGLSLPGVTAPSLGAALVPDPQLAAEVQPPAGLATPEVDAPAVAAGAAAPAPEAIPMPLAPSTRAAVLYAPVTPARRRGLPTAVALVLAFGMAGAFVRTLLAEPRDGAPA